MVVFVISVQELYAFLGSDKDFTGWFKYHIESFKLIDKKDYSDLLTKNVINSGIKRGRGRVVENFASYGKSSQTERP